MVLGDVIAECAEARRRVITMRADLLYEGSLRVIETASARMHDPANVVRVLAFLHGNNTSPTRKERVEKHKERASLHLAVGLSINESSSRVEAIRLTQLRQVIRDLLSQAERLLSGALRGRAHTDTSHPSSLVPELP